MRAGSYNKSPWLQATVQAGSWMAQTTHLPCAARSLSNRMTVLLMAQIEVVKRLVQQQGIGVLNKQLRDACALALAP